MSFRPSTFTWYCFLNLGFKTCPWYDSYGWTDSLLLCLEIWSFVSLWIVSVPIINQSHIMHKIALWQWGFAGSCVLCMICFVYFIECLMAFFISLLLQTVLTLCCRPFYFLFFDVLLLLFCAAAASWLSAVQCLFIFSLIIFLQFAAMPILSALRQLFIYSLLVILSCTLQICLYSQPCDISSYILC